MAVKEHEPHGALVARIERITELPMSALALAYLIALIVTYLPNISPENLRIAEFVEYTITAIFAAELIVKVAVAERRIAYLRGHWLDAVIILMPLLRPLRMLRVLRLLPVAMRALIGLRRLMGPYRGTYIVGVGLVSARCW